MAEQEEGLADGGAAAKRQRIGEGGAMPEDLRRTSGAQANQYLFVSEAEHDL